MYLEFDQSKLDLDSQKVEFDHHFVGIDASKLDIDYSLLKFDHHTIILITRKLSMSKYEGIYRRHLFKVLHDSDCELKQLTKEQQVEAAYKQREQEFRGAVMEEEKGLDL